MKTVIGVILGVILGIIIIVVVVVALILPSTSSTGQRNSVNGSSPAPGFTPPASIPQPTSNANAPSSNVNFVLNVTNVSGSGLSRTVTAQLSNTGSADAHNCWLKE